MTRLFAHPNRIHRSDLEKTGYLQLGPQWTDPQDAVTIEAEFEELPDGTDHVASAEIESASKHLTVKLTNWSSQ